MQKLHSKNEWDPLKKVIVGRAEFARVPELDISVRTVNHSHIKDIRNIPVAGYYPTQVIEEATEDLEKLCETLLGLGVEVHRPTSRPTNYYNYCPRDLVTVIGNVAYAAPMSLQCRKDEYKNFQNLLHNLVVLPNDLTDNNYNLNSVGNKDILALNEIYPKFDAANMIRANDDILYLVSNTGNKIGAEYLQHILHDPNIKIHKLENVYSYIHIDSTVAFLREGLMLLNPERIHDKSVLPKPFCDWDAIFAPEPVDIGHYPGHNNASTWVSVNLLSVNPNLVILEEHQTNLATELEKYNIESIMLPMRHARTLGGCFHCVTLDLVRG